MKTIILFVSILFTITLFPQSGISNTNPFLELLQKAVTPQHGPDCGDPYAQPAQQFCTCFNAAIIAGCRERLPAPACQIPLIKARIRAIGVNNTCHKFPPPHVKFEECTKALNFFLNNCN